MTVKISKIYRVTEKKAHNSQYQPVSDLADQTRKPDRNQKTLQTIKQAASKHLAGWFPYLACHLHEKQGLISSKPVNYFDSTILTERSQFLHLIFLSITPPMYSEWRANPQ